MVRKLLLYALILGSFQLSAQSYVNEIATSGLPTTGGEILGVLDYNNDGFTDVVYGNSTTGQVQIYKNNSGVFTNATNVTNFPVVTLTGGGNQSAIPFDYNGDGFIDLLMASSGTSGGLRLFKNNCGVNFTDESLASQLPASLNLVGQYITEDPMILITDYDRDNDNDIVVCRKSLTENSVSVYVNSNGIFGTTPNDLVTSIPTTSLPFIAFFDYDRDNDEDLLLILSSNINNSSSISLYDNGSGSFTVQSGTGLTVSSAVGFASIFDVNNDGFDDILLGTKEVILPGPGNNGNRVFLNNGGNSTFSNVTSFFTTYQSAILGDNYQSNIFDYDNDGDVDVLWSVRSNSGGNNRPAFREQTGIGTFSSNSSLDALSIASGTRSKLVVFDYNNDGKMDVFGQTSTGNALMRNNHLAGNYVKVKLQTCSGQGIPIGSKVYVSAGGRGQFKSYNYNQTFTSTAANSLDLHFGLGSASVIDTIMVFFQNFANITTLTNVSINQAITITDGTCKIGEALVFELPTDSMTECGGGAALLTAPAGFATYKWSTGESTPDIAVNSIGWYTCSVENAAGCKAIDSVYVKFGFAYVLPVDTIICEGASVTINAYPRFDCSPFGAPSKIKKIIPEFVDAGTFNGHHYYMYTISGAWKDAAQVAINNGGFLASINSDEEQKFIENNPALAGRNLWIGLYNENTGPFVWMNCDTFNYSNWQLSAGAPTPNPSDNYVFMRAETCPDGRQWKNTTELPPIGDPCESTIFGLIEFDDATNIDYIWSTGETGPTITVKPSGPLTVVVEVIQNGSVCYGSSNISVNNFSSIFSIDTLTECSSNSVLLQAQTGFASYQWSTGAITDNITVFSGGWYKVTALSSNGCSGSDSIFVILYNSSIKTQDTTVCAGVSVTLRGPTTPFSYQTDYSQNFQGLSYPDWNTNSSINYSGTRILGPFANDSITLNLLGLVAHDSVSVTFDLFIHDTWEGDCSSNGPDRFRFKNGNTNILNTTFSNTTGCNQAFSASGLPGSFAPKSGAASINLINRCQPGATTTKYTITRRFRHTSSNLDLSWIGDLRDAVDNSTKCNESWSIDNLSIQLRREGGGLLWSTGDSTQDIFVTPTDPSNIYWVRIPVGSSFCYDTVTVTTVTGELPHNLIFSDTINICNASLGFYPITVSNRYDFYNWSNGEKTNIANAYNTGWYKVTAALVQGCFANDSVYVPFHDLEIIPTDTSICYGNPLELKVDYNNDCSPFGGPALVNYTAGDIITGYTYKGEFKGSHYYQADAPSSWSVAAQNALTAGGHLVNILDAEEQGFIGATISDNVWLGLYRNDALGYHIWMNCDTLTYSNWASSEPVATPENYTFMYGIACTEAQKWKSHVDDPSTLTDPCLTNIYGLLEIKPNTYEYNWYDAGFNLISNSPTIFVNPTSNTTFRAFHRLFPNGVACNSGFSNIKVINDNFNILQDSVVKLNCNGDTAMVVAAPGFSNYLWDNGQTTQIAVYSATIGWVYCSYDNGTCIFRDSVYLIVPGKLQSTTSLKDITCKGDNNGDATITAAGGIPPFTYTWVLSGSSSQTESNLAPGNYPYIITDSLGCIYVDSISITEPTIALSVSNLEFKGVSCNGDSNAILVPRILGGEAPYTGIWTGFTANDTLFNVPAGSYTYTVTDVRGCTKSANISISQPSSLSINATLQKQIFCPEDSNGVILLDALGGTSPYSFLWNGNLLGTDTLTNVYRGLFTAIVIDKNGCKDTLQIEMLPSNTNPDLCGLVVPSGFSPNGDGQNDGFYIKGLEGYPDNELTIFNRWGETIFTATNYKNDWTGKPTRNSIISTADGLVPNDTYYYVLVTKANNKTYSGYVYITR